MKVIFLEVEGVLNYEDSDARLPESGSYGIASSCLKNLKKIITETGARIVLISSWKKGWNFDEEKCTGEKAKYLVKKFKRYGLHVMDVTKNDPCDSRKNHVPSIKAYLSFHTEVTNFIIVDSVHCEAYKEYDTSNNLILSSFIDGGLTEELAEQAIKKLNYTSEKREETL